MSPRTPCPVAPPTCCGSEMADTTTIFDSTRGAYRFECVHCEFQILATDEPDDGVAPSTPTDAPAGSPAKVDVMAARAFAGETLFHPLDCTQTVPVATHQTGRRAASGLPRGVDYGERKGMYRARARAGGARVFVGWFFEADAAGRAVEMAEAGDLEGARAAAHGKTRRERRDASGLPRGVWYSAWRNENGWSPYCARITVGGVRRMLGWHRTIEAAAAAAAGAG